MHIFSQNIYLGRVSVYIFLLHSFPIAAISLAKSYINLYNNYKVIYTYIKLYKNLKVI